MTDAQINNSIDNLQAQINGISAQVSTEAHNLNMHILDCDADIELVNSKINLLRDEDSSIHGEIHIVASEVDDHESRINTLEVDNEENALKLSALEEADDDLQQQIEDMDVEHHEELHHLGSVLDEHLTRLNNLEIFKEDTPKHVVLSEEEYENMGEHDFNTFYFTYEED